MIDDELDQDEYDHHYENIDEDEIRERRGSLRAIIWIVAVLIIFVLIGLPVVRILAWDDDDGDPDAAASEARAFVAARFAEAALAQRSAEDAARWASPDLRDEIDAIVDELQRRPAADLAGATISVARVGCDGSSEPDRECFQAWMRRPMATDLIRVAFVIDIINGEATVIDIERVNVV